MNSRPIFALLLAVLLPAASAQSATMGTAPIYATTADDVDCAVFNAGTTAVTITSLRIIRSDGSVAQSATCTGALAPGNTCVVVHAVNVTGLHACRLVIGGTAKSGLRGSIFRRNSANVVDTEPLR